MTFKLGQIQLEALQEWKEGIKELYGQYGVYSYTFTPTGIGDIVKVKSSLTGTEFDLSEYDRW